MLDLDATTICDVLLLPERGGAPSVVTARSEITLLEAVRFVVEDLGHDTCERAVIRTPRRNVFASEAIGLYALFSRRLPPEERVALPVAAAPRRRMQGQGRPAPRGCGAFAQQGDSHFSRPHFPGRQTEATARPAPAGPGPCAEPADPDDATVLSARASAAR